MAGISIHVDDDVQIDPMTQQAIDGKWPMSIAVQSYCGTGESRHIFQRDQISLHGNVRTFRAFANAILAALPAESFDEVEERLNPYNLSEDECHADDGPSDNHEALDRATDVERYR